MDFAFLHTFLVIILEW